MSQHIQKMSKEHYYNWCKHRNNQCHYNCLILGNSIKVTKIRITEWKTDKRWSYE